MSDDATIEAGREALARIRETGRKSFDDWVTVARALAIGRGEALKAAGTNRPYGVTFTRASAQWLRQAGLTDLNDQERSRAIKVLENLPAILVWRDGLDEAQRGRFNHPNSVMLNWRRSIRPPMPTTGSVPRVSSHKKPVSIHWPQDAIRRAAEAIRECSSGDIFVMARRALEAAIRSEADLLQVLPPPPGHGSMTAARAIAERPDWSNRKIAEAIGISLGTVNSARAGEQNCSPEKRTGRDGKKQAARKRRPAPQALAEA